VLAAYIDESGTHRQRIHNLPITLVAGYVADVDKWALFSAEWKRILKNYNVGYFHAKEFRNGNSKIFRHLGHIDRRDLLGALIANIRKTVVSGLICAVDPVEYKRLTTPEFRSRHGSPYTMCVRGCMQLLYHLFPAPGEESVDVGVFLEEGHVNLGQAEELIREEKLETDPIPLEFRDTLHSGLLPEKEGFSPDDPFGDKGLKIASYGHGSKRSMPPLQAADLLAYLSYAYISSFFRDTFAGDKLTALTKGIPHGGLKYDREKIGWFVEYMVNWEKEQKGIRRNVATLIRELNAVGMRAKDIDFGLDIDFSNATEEGMRRFFPEWTSKTVQS
jgi:hypothetical protein